MKLKISLLQGLLALALSQFGAAYADTNLHDFTKICTLQENCAVDRPTLIAFGSQGNYAYRTQTGHFICAAETFGLSNAPTDAVCLSLNSGLGSSSSSSGGSSAEGVQSDAPAVASGLYALISRSSGKALEVNQSAKEDGAAVSQSDFVQGPHQQWHLKETAPGYYALIASHSGKALEVKDWAVADGARLQQFPWIDSWTQHWQLEAVEGGYYRLASRFNNKVIDVYELNRKNGGDVRTWTYWGGENQHWRLVPLTDLPAADPR